jgi:peroxidase
MDLITPEKFDNKYYVGLTNNLGLFTSDAALLTNATMKALVDSFVSSEATWMSKFAESMVKMGEIEVLTGTQGEIRPRFTLPVEKKYRRSPINGFIGFIKKFLGKK